MEFSTVRGDSPTIDNLFCWVVVLFCSFGFGTSCSESFTCTGFLINKMSFLIKKMYWRMNRRRLCDSHYVDFYNEIVQGSWIVRQSVGSTPCLLGKAVDCNYIRGPKYLEVKPLNISQIYTYVNILYMCPQTTKYNLFVDKIMTDLYSCSCLTNTVLFVD